MSAPGQLSAPARRPVWRIIRRILGAIGVWVAVVMMILPFVWTVATSFKSEIVAVQDPPAFIFSPTLDNYRDVLRGEFAHYLTNSVIVTAITTIAVIAIAYPLAYALAVQPIRGWRDVLFFLISTRMMPLAGVVVPLYMTARVLGLLDSRITLIVLYTAMNLPIAVWLLRSYLLEVPTTILEAARLDGASTRTEILRIALPMTLPSVAAAAALVAIFTWNEFFLAVSLTSVDAGTLPVYLSSFQSNRGLFLAKLSAITVLTAVPTILIGWLAQRRLIQGFSFGTDH